MPYKIGLLILFQQAYYFCLNAAQVILFLDFFVVALMVQKSLEMFASPIETWIPFTLIFTSTYLIGSMTVIRKLIALPGMKSPQREQTMSKDNLTTYQIRVQGRLDESWSDWLGMAITLKKDCDGSDITTLN